jgi:hypothetical protein
MLPIEPKRSGQVSFGYSLLDVVEHDVTLLAGKGMDMVR